MRMHPKIHRRPVAAAAMCLALLSSLICGPSSASQATLVTPGSPLPMTGLAAFLNAAFLSVGSCNSGNSAPANGTGGAAFSEECWANTTGGPSSIPFAYYDGAQWVTFGTLNATAHTWTPYFGANPTSETAPLSGVLSSGVLTIALQYDANFVNNGSNQLAFANIANGSLLANSGASSAEPTGTTPTAWLNRWCSSTQYNFPQAGASSWACGTVSQLLLGGTGISLSGTGQVTIALSTPVVVANGGTGQTSLTANAFLTGNGTGGVNQVAITGLVLGNGSSAPTSYGGANCANQVITALSAAGAATCNNITNAYLTAGTFSNITGVGALTTGTWNATAIGLGFGGTGQTSAAASRGSSGLNIDECTSTGSSAYAIASTDRCVYHTSLSGAVTDTLPAANSVNAGQQFVLLDFRGVASATNTITLAAHSGDTINGVAGVTAINAQYGAGVYWSDGSSRWTFFPQSTGGGSGTVTNVTIAAGATITTSGTCTITTSGTCTIAGRTFQYFVVTSSNSAWNVASNFGYTPSELFLELWAGGASGGAQSGGTNTSRGAGGGGGQYGFKQYSGTMDATLNITIGAAGASCTSGCGGSGGGTTSVVGTNLGTVSVAGAAGPGCAGSGCAGGQGGNGASGTTFNIAGQQGGSSFPLTNYFGVGGDAPRGGQGAKSNVSTAGGCPGGGGSGENHTGGGSGAGCAGEVIIWGR